jgi:hypothetical protein
VTWQPESSKSPRRGGPRRGGLRLAALGALLAVGLSGLAVSAVGAAHQLLPRQFTPAQQRQIVIWEMGRPWRVLPAGKIFPAAVAYVLPGAAINAASGLVLHAHRLGISSQTNCSAALTGPAVRILGDYHCTAVLRATYVDSSGSLVATLAVAVLPDPALARAALSELTAMHPRLLVVRALRVARTEAAGFGDPQRQLTDDTSAGPYVIMATAGFSDGRRGVRIGSDFYLDQEMASLAGGLSKSASMAMGRTPAAPTCPGTPGC